MLRCTSAFHCAPPPNWSWSSDKIMRPFFSHRRPSSWPVPTRNKWSRA